MSKGFLRPDQPVARVFFSERNLETFECTDRNAKSMSPDRPIAYNPHFLEYNQYYVQFRIEEDYQNKEDTMTNPFAKLSLGLSLRTVYGSKLAQ